MPTSASHSPSLPKSSIQFQHASLSLEVPPCQEDSKNDKEKNIKKDQDQEPSMSSNTFHDVSYLFHGSFDPTCPFSFIPPCLKSSPKKDQATTYTVELIDNQNNLTTLALSKDDTSIKVIKNRLLLPMLSQLKIKKKIICLCYPKVKIKFFHLLVLPLHVRFHFLLFLSLLKLQTILSKKFLLFKMFMILLQILMLTLKMLMSLVVI